MIAWNDPDEEWRAPPADWMSIPRAMTRLVILLTSLIICIIPFTIVRYGQRIFGLRHYELSILQFWGKIAVWCFGLRAEVHGDIQIEGGMITANHVNFIDIPLIFSIVPGYMMAKYEIKHWIFIGWCARILGTEFVRRDPLHTGSQVASLTKRVQRGDRMIIFPEATTTDGQRIIPFRSSMFEAIAQVTDNSRVQPISMYYHAPEGASTNFFGHWGESKLLPQMWATFASKGIKRVEVTIADPLPEGLGRKELAQTAESVTRENFTKLKDAATKP